MKITISIECNTVAESQQILAQLNAQAPVGVQRNITIAKVDATGSDADEVPLRDHRQHGDLCEVEEVIPC